MANDILNHPNFVKKNLCNSFSDRTVQRFYKFNTSIVVSGVTLIMSYKATENSVLRDNPVIFTIRLVSFFY